MSAVETIRRDAIALIEGRSTSLTREEWRELIEKLSSDMESRLECMDDEDAEDEGE